MREEGQGFEENKEDLKCLLWRIGKQACNLEGLEESREKKCFSLFLFVCFVFSFSPECWNDLIKKD